ncbi:sulfite reductase (NADPH) flavoprotein alpha-component [Duganella sp. 1411]|uniref:PepSY domain-containing protein n=1 Tax=Duganella sp. 1411 TaxID=2806572 RepID=UPI001AE6A93C|nr:sulfite reductase (NADPH) flavoprotein alpha-component [Duganella sp. 1411]
MKKLWFQLHWFVGITAGTILILIGLTGAILAFREELLDLINPGVLNVPVESAPVLAPPQVAQAAKLLHPQARITGIIVYTEPGTTARVTLAPAPGEERGETIYLNPYTGALLPPLRFNEAFEWVELLHRHLLLPRDVGRIVLGILAICLLGLSLSGLYLRWPRRVFDWRTWLTFDTRLKGRSFLWGLHSVAGTWSLIAYVVFTLTGLYWSFDVVRDTVDGWLGTSRPPRMATAPKPKGAKPPRAAEPAADLGATWATFEHNAPNWKMAFLRPPERATQPIQILWVAKDAPHVRARGRMSINQQTGAIVKNEPYKDMTAGARAQSTIYPLHMGTYFGLPGRLFMFFTSLALPGFAITGWMLYLKRRRQKRVAQAERARFAAGAGVADAGLDPVLMAYASQTGQAERLALQSAAALQKAGVPVHVHSLEKLTPPQLGKYRRALFVASSFGEGEPPDAARRFSRLLQTAAEELAHMQYAVLALGDRNYAQFCGFGQTLDQRLRVMGARPLHPIIEVDNGDAGALARWSHALRELIGGDSAEVALSAAVPESDYTRWRLMERALLNPGSIGGGLYEITLCADDAGAVANWRPGALVDIWPGHYAPAGASEEQRQAVAPRRYSLASLPSDGGMQLLVRQVKHGQGMGLASGWLTEQASLGDEVRVRLVANPSFDAHPQPLPSIYIGNGSGMAGLRSHLRARVREGARRNWLIFGERQREFDGICAGEIRDYRERGFLPELDLVFSRDVAGGEYVQDRMRVKADALRAWIADGAVLYICGSLQGMAGGVEAALEEIIGRAALDDLIETGRYRRDVY